MMPVNGLEPEPALGSVSFAEGAETASGAGTGVRGAGDAGHRGQRCRNAISCVLKRAISHTTCIS